MNGAKPQTKAKRSDAFILKKGDDDYVVRPAYAVVDGTKGEFAIRNLTGSDSVKVTILAGANRKPVTRRPRMGKQGVFRLRLTRKDQFITYTVKVNGRFARGESDPVIIIDPPAN